MFIPLGDENRPGALFPLVNWFLIGANIVGFLIQQTRPELSYSYSLVPHEILTGKDIQKDLVLIERAGYTREAQIVIPHRPGPRFIYLTLLTSMFMHANLLHLLGNMLFLWIFGDNLEDAMGRWRYALYYLSCGLLAGLMHVALSTGVPNRYIHTVGASGAISGVLGGYIVLFPHSAVTGIFFRVLVTVPAWVALGLWFIFQLVMAFLDVGGGVAYGAHIGGFVAGVGLVYLFGMRRSYPGWIGRA